MPASPESMPKIESLAERFPRAENKLAPVFAEDTLADFARQEQVIRFAMRETLILIKKNEAAAKIAMERALEEEKAGRLTESGYSRQEAEAYLTQNTEMQKDVREDREQLAGIENKLRGMKN